MVAPIRSLPPARPPVPQASAPARPPAMLEADASMRMAPDGSLLANGTVKADHGFMLRLVKHVLRNPKRFSDIAVHFDPATSTYAASGKLKLGPIWLPVTARARAIVDHNTPGFRLEGAQGKLFGVTLKGDWLTARATTEIVNALNKDYAGATGDPATGTVRIPANGILVLARGIPGFLKLDERHTRFGMQTSSEGDLTLTMAADGTGPAAATSAHSDFAVSADAAALTAFLSAAMGGDYQVQKVTPRANGARIEGLVEYAPLSEALDVIKGIAAVVKLRTEGGSVDMTPSKAMGPLALEAQFDGTKVVLKPSLKPAAKLLADKMTAAGIPVTREADGLHFDIAPWLASKGIKVSDMHVGPGGLDAHLELDIDSRIKNPNLRPSAR